MTKKGSGIDFAFRLYCPKVLPEGVKSFSLETFGKKKKKWPSYLLATQEKVLGFTEGQSGKSVREERCRGRVG